MLQYPASGGKIAKSNVKQKPKSHRMICLTEYIPECLMLDVFSVIWICVLQISQKLWLLLCVLTTSVQMLYGKYKHESVFHEKKKKTRHWMHRVLKSLRVNLKKKVPIA